MNDLATGELVKYLKALVALQVQVIAGNKEAGKPEVLLARVGLPARDIADVLGKSQDAVVKTLQRAGKR
jgi:DNA-directed RNA polymerase specialized sigma24 family protein